MYYYEVLPADASYNDNRPLTYHSPTPLTLHTIVKVTLKNNPSYAVITKKVSKPSFTTKAIIDSSDLGIPKTHLRLLVWLSSYYPAPGGKIVSLFVPGYLRLHDDGTAAPLNSKPKPQSLNERQQAIVGDILGSDQLLHILHGDTGSGKTRIHLQLAYQVLQQGRSVLLLTPEIGLAPQLLHAAQETFGEACVVFHSRMTLKKRRETWRQVATSNVPLVIVGTRSAVFLPITNLGLIVVDEFHDTSYKQDQSPYYQTTRVASKLATITGAKTILSSATPSVADYYAFTSKNLPIHRLRGTAIKHSFADTLTIVDRKEHSEFTRSRLLSNIAIEAIKHNHKTNQQTLVFHNRRGTARTVLCSECGWQQLCPRCDINMTYHGDKHRVICHACGLNQQTPPMCPECNNPDVIYKNEGTKTIEAEVQKIVAGASVARFDGDNTKGESLDQQYHTILNNSVSVIVGTQMITKGLDLPHLRTVVVVAAENQLQFPDYSANEKTYQQLSQVIGRAKRGHKETQTIVQSIQPDSQLLMHALQNDYDSFYKKEIDHRKKYSFPPFGYVLVVKITRKTLKGATNASAAVHTLIQNAFSNVNISQPHPSFREKLNNQYRWQIVVKATNRQDLLKIIHVLPPNTTHDIDPNDLL